MNLPRWNEIWRTNFTTAESLLDFCEIRPEQRSAFLIDPSFSCSVPRRYAEKMEKGSVDDPLFRQVAPLKEEAVENEQFANDPLEEDRFKCSPCLIQKYHGRALLVATHACCMHCRFCLRRHFPYSLAPSEKEFTWFETHTDIEEVILSGGDPLALPTKRLKEIFLRLERMPHIQRIRIHTRFPIGIPERIDDELLDLFAKCQKQLVMVLHVNHAKELDEDIAIVLGHIGALRIPLLNQTVLLRGVNDSAPILRQLMQALTKMGVLPYYLHQLDRVQGASHFEVPTERGKELISSLQATLSGYMVPRYVQEIPGKAGKHPVEDYILGGTLIPSSSSPS